MLLLIVGPTGAGKDTLLAAARRHLEADDRFRFVRRVTTKAPDPASLEHYESVEDAVFIARRDAGQFLTHWRQHGHLFGIPAEITTDLRAGRNVVANVSRVVVAELATHHDLRVIEISAPPDLLARRLAAMGRGDAVAAARLLSRPPASPAGVQRETVVNDGTVEQGARKLIAALLRAAESVPPAEKPLPAPAG